MSAPDTKAWYRNFDRVGTILGLVIGVGGLVSGVYFYLESVKEPELTYSALTIGALNRPTFDSDFQFTYRGQKINSDFVSIAEVAIWNEGRQSIKATDILQPVSLTLPQGCQVCSVKIKKATRDLCQFKVVKPEDFAAGKINLAWNILEHNDGATIQVIYLGGAQQPFTLSGAVEGQAQMGEAKMVVGPILIFCVIGFAVGTVVIVLMLANFKKSHAPWSMFTIVAVSLIIIAIPTCSIYAINFVTQRSISRLPPMGW